MNKEKQKKLCDKIYKFAVKFGDYTITEDLKLHLDQGDYDKAINFANYCREWLAGNGFKKKHVDKISNFCGGKFAYKLWHENGQLWINRKSKYEYAEWDKCGQIRIDQRSKFKYKIWYECGQLWTDERSEYERKVWRKNGQIAIDQKSEYERKEWYECGQLYIDQRSKFEHKMWHKNGQLKTDQRSEFEYIKWDKNGNLIEEKKMKKEKQKKLCEKIYKFAVKNNACKEVEAFKSYLDAEDYVKAINFANGQRKWLVEKNFRQKHLDKISDFCGGELAYKSWWENGQIFTCRKSRFQHKNWDNNGQLRFDQKSEFERKMWHENGQLELEQKSEFEYKKWDKKGNLIEEKNEQRKTKEVMRQGL